MYAWFCSVFVLFLRQRFLLTFASVATAATSIRAFLALSIYIVTATLFFNVVEFSSAVTDGLL